MGHYRWIYPEFFKHMEAVHTWQEIGDELGISAARAQQIAVEALRKIQGNAKLKQLYLDSLEKESGYNELQDTSYRYSSDAYLGD